ncbi:MAG: CBS domain-containing protein [Thermoproteota archaeon]|nr:CBS domain-containing protein [Thermoproteota archaeon]
MAETILVRDIMTKNVKTARRDFTIREVVRKMNKFNIGSVVIVQEKRPVGIITERDILRKIVEPGLDPTMMKAGEVMSSPLILIDKETSVEEAARLMAKRGIKKLPIVQDEKLVGIITSMDIVRMQPNLLSLLEEKISY